MKKLLLSLTLVLSSIFYANAQCTPDPSITDLIVPPAGSRFDTVNGKPFVVLPHGYVGQNYNEVLYFNIPTDTPAFGSVATINYVKLDSVLNLPTGFSISCDQPGCKIFGGSAGCLTMSGIPQYNDSIELEIAIVYNITINGLSAPLSDTIGGFYFVTKGGQSVGIEEVAESNSTPKLYPNPASRRLSIDYNAQSSSSVEVIFTNMLGRIVASKSMDTHIGSNTFDFDVHSLSPGVYLYTIQENQKTFTGRFTISR